MDEHPKDWHGYYIEDPEGLENYWEGYWLYMEYWEDEPDEPENIVAENQETG